MLLLFIDQPQQIGWHWLPGSLLVILAISLLLNRDKTNRHPNEHTNQLLRRPEQLAVFPARNKVSYPSTNY